MLTWTNINLTTRLLVNFNLILKDVLNHAIAWPARHTLAGSLKSVPNTLSDEAHVTMDKEVVEMITMGPHENWVLLLAIVAHSGGLLDSKYDVMTTTALIKGNPQLAQMLQVAWGKSQFGDIRNLSAVSVYLRQNPSQTHYALAEILRRGFGRDAGVQGLPIELRTQIHFLVPSSLKDLPKLIRGWYVHNNLV
jgi:hypothetical protein